MRRKWADRNVNEDRMFGFEIGKYWNVNSEKLCYEKVRNKFYKNTVYFYVSGKQREMEKLWNKETKL